MDVDHAVVKILRDQHMPDETGHRDVFGVGTAAGPKDGIPEAAAIRTSLRLNDLRGNARATSMVEPRGCRVARYDQANFHIEHPGRNSYQKIAERSATAGDEDRDG